MILSQPNVLSIPAPIYIVLITIVPYSFKPQYLLLVINSVILQCLTSSLDGMVYMVGSVFFAQCLTYRRDSKYIC